MANLAHNCTVWRTYKKCILYGKLDTEILLRDNSNKLLLSRILTYHYMIAKDSPEVILL